MHSDKMKLMKLAYDSFMELVFSYVTFIRWFSKSILSWAPSTFKTQMTYILYCP